MSPINLYTMSTNCNALFCQEKCGKNSKLSFFQFPRNKDLFKKWAELCGKPNLIEHYNLIEVTNTFYKFKLCEEHFNNEDIIVYNGKKVLRRDAVPLQYLKLKCKGSLRPPKKFLKVVTTTNFSSDDELKEPDEPEDLTINVTEVDNSKFSGLDVTVDLSNFKLRNLSSISSWSKVLRPNKLCLDNNNLKDLENVMQFERLTQLSLANNEIGTLAWCMYLKNLEVLNLSNNKLYGFYGIISLPKLRQLNLSGNLIEKVPLFPPSFAAESKLESLDLSSNKIKGFLNFSQFTELKELLLHQNMITWSHPLDNVLPCLLTKLTLAYNAFSDLLQLRGLQHYKLLTELTIEGNPCVGSLMILDANGKQMGNIRETNFRPYMLTCCPNLNLLDAKPIGEKDKEKSLWLSHQMFSLRTVIRTHGELVLYLAETCSLASENLGQNVLLTSENLQQNSFLTSENMERNDPLTSENLEQNGSNSYSGDDEDDDIIEVDAEEITEDHVNPVKFGCNCGFIKF